MLIGVRGFAQDMVDGAAGVDAQFAEDSDAAGELVAGLVKDGDVILVKGSRGVRTEKVIEKLLEKFELEEERGAE
jgi:UDP-N-acetylmuramoyl-tripeptide--D-alanyl-D-alanine ligase